MCLLLECKWQLLVFTIFTSFEIKTNSESMKIPPCKTWKSCQTEIVNHWRKHRHDQPLEDDGSGVWWVVRHDERCWVGAQREELLTRAAPLPVPHRLVVPPVEALFVTLLAAPVRDVSRVVTICVLKDNVEITIVTVWYCWCGTSIPWVLSFGMQIEDIEQEI